MIITAGILMAVIMLAIWFVLERRRLRNLVLSRETSYSAPSISLAPAPPARLACHKPIPDEVLQILPTYTDSVH